jgi:hypothetical protein
VQPAGGGRRHLVLDGDVRPVWLAVLGAEERCPGCRKIAAQLGQPRALDPDRRAAAEEERCGGLQREGGPAGRLGDVREDAQLLGPRQVVEQRQVRRDEVALRREVFAAQAVEVGKRRLVEGERQDQRRWGQSGASTGILR